MQVDTATYYLKEFDRLTEAFVDTLSCFSKANFNTPIGEGLWSPGEVVEHLIKSDQATIKLIDSELTVVEGRKPDEKCAQIEQVFRLTKERYPAPAGLHPESKVYNPVDLLDTFVDIRAEMRVAFDFASDIAGVVTSFKHPLFGEMTACEWLYFTAIHGERHRLQVDRVVPEA